MIANIFEDSKIFGMWAKPELGDQWEIGGEGVECARDEAEGFTVRLWQAVGYEEEDVCW